MNYCVKGKAAEMKLPHTVGPQPQTDVFRTAKQIQIDI